MSTESDLLSTGIQYHQAGRVEEAHEIYRQVHSANPTSPIVLSLLGAACINLRRWDEAARYLDEALRLDPDNAAAHDNRGVLLAKQGRMAEAVESFRRAVELNPDNAQTHLNLAAALERVEAANDAIESYRTAAHLAPKSLKAHSEAGRLLHAAGRVTEAVPYYRQVTRLKPLDPKAHFELAAVLALAGQTSEAIAAYQETLRLRPDSAESFVNLSQLYSDKQDYHQAAECARSALALRPTFAEAHLNLASALSKLGQAADAKAALTESIRHKPDLAQAYNNLGNLLADERDFAGAEEQYRRTIELRPQGPDAWYNLGLALLRRGDLAAAIEHFDRALALRPNWGEAHHNRASALLQLGRFEEGLAEYEWRFASRDFPPYRPRWKAWDGSDPAGKSIVIVAEQGLGDTLQFIRYARLLADRGASVTVQCPASLHPLLARTPGVEAWISPSDAAPEADGCVPMMSLPWRLGTTLETVPADVPYIFADPERTAAWQAEVAAIGGFKIGIAWQGNPRAPFDRERSIPLAQFEPIAAVPGVRLVSLQKGPGAEQLATVADRWNVVDLAERLDASGGAFEDTAAIIAGLDLLVTSDTALAHLAGAMGKPVWVALQTVPDWRWLLQREDSPWYPTMRLFRQQELGDWQPVFKRMSQEVSRR